MRVIRALHELGIEAVSVYSTADRDALHVELADQSVCIGPPAAAESYLQISNLVAAAETTGCDAVHPGYGFLAENAEFVRACDDNNLVFVGPPADVVEQMGDKVRAKEAMRSAGVPLVPGSNGTAGLEELRQAAADAGFPVLLKAAAGGGGKGMRLVESEDELEGALAAASTEAEAAFGDGSVYVEKLVAPARHVEIQVLCDAENGVLTLGERECSIQRRHQKLVEESPSAALDSTRREEMEATVERACRAIGYRNAGTFEFLVGPDGAFYFIEVNCRLQVEHPVSELVTGIDIVREQIRIAAGEPLALSGRAQRRGHAIEIRINAEDPAQRLPPRPRHDHAVRRPARAGRARRYGRSGRIRDSAVLRLDDREARRVGRHPRCGHRPGRARSARGGDRGDSDHTRPRARRSRLAGVQERRLLDVDADRARGPPAVPRAGMTPTTSRKAARRQALYLLYQWDLTGQELASLYEGEPDAFARSLAEAVAVRADALDLRITAASPDWPAEPTRHARAEYPAHRRVRARGGDGAARGRDQRGGRPGQALRDRGCRAARERDPRAGCAGGRGGMTPVDEALARAEELLGTLNAKREELERLAASDDVDGDAAVDLITELAELARQIEAELTRARSLADATG